MSPWKKSAYLAFAFVLAILPASLAEASGTVQGRLNYVSATQLAFAPFNGTVIEVNGEDVDFGSGFLVSNTDNLIDDNGADTGFDADGVRMYFAYISNSTASYASESLRLSETAPDGLISGIKYLGGSGNAVHWRYVGKAYRSFPGFHDEITKRNVSSYYNRVAKDVFICPSYSNNNLWTSYFRNTSTWDSLATVSFVCHGDESATFEAFSRSYSASGWGNVGIGVDTDTSIRRSGQNMSTSGLDAVMNSCRYDFKPDDGLRVIHISTLTSGGSVRFDADSPRNGASSDVPTTYLTGKVRN